MRWVNVWKPVSRIKKGGMIRKMKDTFLITLIIIMVCIIAFGGCAQPEQTTAPQPASEESSAPPQQSSTEQDSTPPPAPEPSPVPRKVVKQVELKYDDGRPNQWAAVVPPNVCGYLIDFTPSSTPFTIKKVRILGMVVGSTLEPEFDVEILDSEKNVIASVRQPIDLFPSGHGNAEWVDIDFADVQVDGKFYVHLYTNTGQNKGIHIGWDDSVPNSHSSVSGVRSDGAVKEVSWPYPDVRMRDKSKVNWMIRVVGMM
jgi:hypothetical protein